MIDVTEDLFQRVFDPQDAQEDLEQIPGTPFFHTPNDPADPQDCNRYPNSPWCGENPINTDNFAGLELSLVRDDCNIGLQLDMTLGFIALPTFQFVYRNPACIPEKQPVMEPQLVDKELFDVTAYCENGTNIQAFPRGEYLKNTLGFLYTTLLPKYLTGSFPGGTPLKTLVRYVKLVALEVGKNWIKNAYTNSPKGWRGLYLEARYSNWGGSNCLAGRYTSSGKLLEVVPNVYIEEKVANLWVVGEQKINGEWRNYEGSLVTFGSVTRFLSPPCPIDRYVKPPAPPEFKKMDCCDNNDQLLRLLLKRVGTFPVAVPSSYIKENDKEPPDRTISSLMELTAWFAERFDEVIGQFEIKIEIDDADLSKDGKQKKTLRIPNLSEAVAEMFTMQFQQTVYTDLMIHMITNVLVESGQIKQIDLKNHSAIMAIAEYMGFPYKNISEKMPLTFTPNRNTFDQLLKETEIDVPVIDYTESKSQAEDMQVLLQAAAIIRAVFFKRAPNDKDKLKQQLKEDLFGLVGDRTGSLIDIVKDYVEDLEGEYVRKDPEGDNPS